MNRFILHIFLALSLSACIDVYNPNNSSNTDLLVVEGMITDQPGPYYLTLSHSRSFTNPGSLINESNAMAEIIDDLGHKEPLAEIEKGQYATIDSAFRGQIGRKYYIHLITHDGKEYKSDPELLTSVAPIDTLYVKPKTNDFIERDYYGKIIQKSDVGFEIYEDTKGNSSDGSYYRYDGILTMQYKVRYTSNSIIPHYSYTFCWLNLPLSEDFVINETHSLKEDMFIGFPVTFISKDTTGLNLIVVRSNNNKRVDLYIEGWIARVKQYSVSREYYQFLQRMLNQINRQDKYFDPAIDQITGNVHCVNNPSQPILGYFAVSALKERAIYFYYSDFGYLEYRMLPDIPPVHEDGFVSSIPPSFWIFPKSDKSE